MNTDVNIDNKMNTDFDIKCKYKTEYEYKHNFEQCDTYNYERKSEYKYVNVTRSVQI